MDDEAYKSFLERQSDVRGSEDLRELMDVSVETITRVSQMGRPRVKAMMLKRIEKDGKRSISPTGSILRFVAETESAMAPMSEPERRDFWEICEDRYQVRSMILTSQLPVPRWHEQIGDAIVADGILDRLVHNARRIEMRGDSMRKNRGKLNT